MHIQRLAASQLHSELADRLKKRQRFDVTHGTTDLDHADVGVSRAQHDAALDLVGDVRNDLHRRTEVIATALFGDHTLIDPAGREVAVAAVVVRTKRS